MKDLNLRLTGSGGQGIILAGIILAEAAILAGKNAIQTQSYGPESRGGASKSEVIISDGEIYFPKIEVPDVVLTLTQVAFNKYSSDISSDGVLIVDESIDIPENFNVKKLVVVPILKTATDVIGKAIVANIIAVALLGELIDAVDKECINSAVLSRVPKGTEELNLKALEAGYQLGKKCFDN